MDGLGNGDMVRCVCVGGWVGGCVVGVHGVLCLVRMEKRCCVCVCVCVCVCGRSTRCAV